MYSYAKIPLADSDGYAPGAWIDANIRPETIFPLASQSWPGSFQNGPLLNITPEIPRPVQINSLKWPRSASRFASAFFVVSAAQLASVRTAVFVGGQQQSAQLVMNNGRGVISPSMWTLPAIPMQTATAGPFYVLPLVDNRYWWWGESVTLTVAAGATTWLALYNAIGAVLGVTIEVDPIATAYGTPPAAYAVGSRPLPLMLDAIAFSVGQRVVVDLAGNVYAQNAATAMATVKSNGVTGPVLYAGGAFAFNPKG